jgi:hypothetical protein
MRSASYQDPNAAIYEPFAGAHSMLRELPLSRGEGVFMEEVQDINAVRVCCVRRVIFRTDVPVLEQL